jgi:hypothetical protein
MDKIIESEDARAAFPNAAASDTWARPAALSSGQVAKFALMLFQGGGVNLKAMRPEDAGAVFIGAMKLLLARWEADREAEAAEAGEAFERPTRASLHFGPGAPSEIMGELLTSVEARAFLSILASCVGAAARLAFVAPHVPPASTWRDSTQDRALNGLVRRKLGLMTVIGESKLEAVEPSLRAWANSLTRREAEYWSDLRRIKAHYADIQAAGRVIRRTWGNALGQLGVRLDALDTSARFLALPAFDPDTYSPAGEGESRRAPASPSSVRAAIDLRPESDW